MEAMFTFLKDPYHGKLNSTAFYEYKKNWI